MALHNELGKQGENIAAEYLATKNYFIIARNFSYLKAEVDIIALQGEKLVVVEVKTRRSPYYADPGDTISRHKLKQIYEAADRFMQVRNIPWEVRFDLVTVVIDEDGTYTLDHIEDAFYPFMNI